MSRIERALGSATGARGRRLLGRGSVLALAGAAALALAVAPPDAEQGQVQRLMYVHVPSAWLAYLSFAVVCAASVAVLRTGRTLWDRVVVASAEIGVLFTGLAIVTGSIWGRPTWGAWWTWDPRLTTTVVLLLVYVGLLVVRGLPDNPERGARWAAVVGVVGFLDVPVVHLSVTWWRSLHQPASVLRPGEPTVAPAMLLTLLAAVVAFTVLYAYLLLTRLHLVRLTDRLAGEVVAGGPRARAPRLDAVPLPDPAPLQEAHRA